MPGNGGGVGGGGGETALRPRGATMLARRLLYLRGRSTVLSPRGVTMLARRSEDSALERRNYARAAK